MSIPQRCQPSRTSRTLSASGSSSTGNPRAGRTRGSRASRRRRRGSPPAARGWPPTAKRGRFARSAATLLLILAATVLLGLAGSGSGGSATSRPRVGDLLLPLVRHARARRRLAALEPARAPAARSISRRTSTPRAARTRATTRASSTRRCARSRATGVGEVVVSWWGRGSREDQRLPLVIRAGARARARGRRPPRAVRRTARSTPSRADLAYLRRLGIRDVLRLRPVRGPGRGLGGAARPADRAPLFAQTPFVARAAAAGSTASTRTTSSTSARLHAPLRAGARPRPAVRAVGRPGLRRAPRDGRHARASRAATARPTTRCGRRRCTRGADLVTITSYNEWHEGTQIEPARVRRGGLRVRDLRRRLGPPRPRCRARVPRADGVLGRRLSGF